MFDQRKSIKTSQNERSIYHKLEYLEIAIPEQKDLKPRHPGWSTPRRWSSTRLKLPSALDQVGMKDWGFRVWGEKRERELGLELALVRMSELVERKRERESDLNAVGPLKIVESSSTGQTGWPDRTDRSGPSWQEQICVGDLSRKFELMTVINLTTED